MHFGQPQAPLELHIEAQDQFGWIMCSVRGMRHDWTSAHSQDGAFRTVDIMKMQAWSVIVSVCVCVCLCLSACCVCGLWCVTYILQYNTCCELITTADLPTHMPTHPHLPYFSLTQTTLMYLQSGWWVEPPQWRVVLKSTTMASGGQSVTTSGISKMHELSATSLDFMDM